MILNEACLLGTFIQKRVLLGVYVFQFKRRKVYQRGVERLGDTFFTSQDYSFICLLPILRIVDVTL